MVHSTRTVLYYISVEHDGEKSAVVKTCKSPPSHLVQFVTDFGISRVPQKCVCVLLRGRDPKRKKNEPRRRRSSRRRRRRRRRRMVGSKTHSSIPHRSSCQFHHHRVSSSAYSANSHERPPSRLRRCARRRRPLPSHDVRSRALCSVIKHARLHLIIFPPCQVPLLQSAR